MRCRSAQLAAGNSKMAWRGQERGTGTFSRDHVGQPANRTRRLWQFRRENEPVLDWREIIDLANGIEPDRTEHLQ